MEMKSKRINKIKVFLDTQKTFANLSLKAELPLGEHQRSA